MGRGGERGGVPSILIETLLVHLFSDTGEIIQ